MNEVQRFIVLQFEKELENYVKKNLIRLGYEFSDQLDFLNFCKNYITRVSSVNEPHSYTLYLNIKDENLLIGCYSDRVEVSNEGYNFNIKIG